MEILSIPAFFIILLFVFVSRYEQQATYENNQRLAKEMQELLNKQPGSWMQRTEMLPPPNPEPRLRLRKRLLRPF